MTLSELYNTINGDYEGVIGRFRGEERVVKFLGMFLRDPSYSELKRNIEEGNCSEAFRAAHTLKGVAANLGMTAMHDMASDITEALRSENMSLANALMPQLEDMYEIVISALNSILEK